MDPAAAAWSVEAHLAALQIEVLGQTNQLLFKGLRFRGQLDPISIPRPGDGEADEEKSFRQWVNEADVTVVVTPDPDQEQSADDGQ